MACLKQYVQRNPRKRRLVRVPSAPAEVAEGGRESESEESDNDSDGQPVNPGASVAEAASEQDTSGGSSRSALKMSLMTTGALVARYQTL